MTAMYRTWSKIYGAAACSILMSTTAQADVPKATPSTEATIVAETVAAKALAPEPDLSGTWYLRMRTATNAKIRFLGNTYVRSTTHLLVRIENRSDGLYQSQQTCIVDTRPSRNITKTVLPEAFVAHLAQKTYPISVTKAEDGTWSYDADLQQQFVGYHGHLAPDGIPKNAKHPAVYDWDEDGKPGASVLVDIPIIGHIRIYLVQTNHTFLKGSIDGPDDISGKTIQGLLGQRTIGADNRLLAASPNLSIGTGHDAFEMIRIATGSTCQDIKRLAKDSF